MVIRRHLYGRNVSVAYPGRLGDELVPPAGYVFLTDDLGVYLTDEAGWFLVAPVTNG